MIKNKNMFCLKCNHLNSNDSKVCLVCGEVLQNTSTTLSSNAENIQNQTHSKQNKIKTILIVSLVTVFILSGLGAVGFFIFSKSKFSPKSSIVTNTNPTSREVNIKGEISQDNFCDKLEKDLQEKYKQDYESCFAQASTENADCQKSGDALDSYKEYLDIIIILDSSGSMAENITGGKKMDIAKKTLNNFIQNLPERAWVGLMAYGHKGSNTTSSKDLSCAGIEMVQPLSAINKDQLTQAINSFQPTGYTPIAGALKKAKEIMAKNDPEKTTNIIYLISDGIETCDGDPVAVAEELNSLNVQTMVNIIGFGVDGSAQAQLQATALAGGGEYYSANSAEEMGSVFSDRSEYLKGAREYADCIQKNAIENRNEIQKTSTQVRDCLQNKAFKERDDIQKEITILLDSGKINYDCFGQILNNADAKKNEITTAGDLSKSKTFNDAEVEQEKIQNESEAVFEKELH